MKIRWMTYLKKELLKVYARRLYFNFERLTKDCQRVQERVLLDKIRRNQKTVYGQEHHFSNLKTVSDYQKAVPLSEYEHFQPFIERAKLGEKNLLTSAQDPIEMFALTSGTTNQPKFIPVTKSFREEYHDGSLIWAARLLYQLSDVMAKGKILQITSPARQFQLPSSMWCGNISGAIAEMQRPVIKEFYAVPSFVSRISNPKARFYTVMRLALVEPVSILITANPSLVLSLAEMVDREKEHLIRDIENGTLYVQNELSEPLLHQIQPRLMKNPKRASELKEIVKRTGRLLPKDIWPELMAIACWTGGTLSYYLEKFPEYFGSVPVREIGLLASEGRFSIPMDGDLARGVLDIANHFFEFIPEDAVDQKKTLLAHELEIGKRYFLVITTSSGLYRYQIHDLIEVTEFFFKAPIIQFLSKASHFSSVTGEKLTEFQVVEAMHKACHGLNVWFDCFRVFPSWGEPPFYNVMIEKSDVEKYGARLENLLRTFDMELQHINMEYQGKRHSHRLAPVKLRIVQDGTFLKEKREKLLRGGSEEQYKPIYLNGDLKHAEKYSFLETVHK